MDILNRVTKLVAYHADATEDQVKLETKLNGDIGLDSLDQVEIMMGAEDEFGVMITDEDAVRITTVQQLVDHLATYPSLRG